MQKAPKLQRGSTVAIISTARKISEQEIQPAVGVLESWGLRVVFGKHLFQSDHQFSGTVAQRLHDLQWALDDPEIGAVICARGGYGTVQLIDQIDFSAFRNNPKWVVGYSDVTVLHNHINQNLNIGTLHASMPINFPNNTDEALESMRAALFGESLHYNFDGHELNRAGQAEGELVGGNLSILYSLTGTASQLNTKGRILFLEDLDEYLYHIDRMMMNLDRAGMLKDLAGMVVGGMTDMNDNAVPYGLDAKQIIREVVNKYDYPVCFDFPAGHLDDNRALLMGAKIKLTVSGQCRLEFN
ncbi:MAG: LD-carboxypeptidase [Flavobacteriales bacterium]|nr:LD-carboxypeptidase [Flavobacteriales bacterium]